MLKFLAITTTISLFTAIEYILLNKFCVGRACVLFTQPSAQYEHVLSLFAKPSNFIQYIYIYIAETENNYLSLFYALLPLFRQEFGKGMGSD